MKTSFLIASAITLFAVCSSADEQGMLIKKENVRNAIGIFRQDPTSQRGRAAGEIVRRYAEKSTDVILTITPKLAPFLSDIKIPPDDRSLLLAAYMVGNVDLQLLRNEKKDDPYAGITEVIETYRQMKKQNPGLSIPDIENFIELEKRGELKAYVASP